MKDENLTTISAKEFQPVKNYRNTRQTVDWQTFLDTRLYPFLFKNAVYVVSKIGNIYNLSNQGNFRRLTTCRDNSRFYLIRIFGIP